MKNIIEAIKNITVAQFLFLALFVGVCISVATGGALPGVN